MFLHGKGPKPVHKQAAALEQARVFIERLRRKIGRGAGFGAAGFQQRRIGTQNEASSVSLPAPSACKAASINASCVILQRASSSSISKSSAMKLEDGRVRAYTFKWSFTV